MTEWTACYTDPGVERKVQSEIEKFDIGTLIPTFARTWLYGGKRRSEEHPILGRYVLVAASPERAGWLGSIEGVQHMLGGRVSEQEIMRLTFQHVMGDFNEVRVRAANGRFASSAAQPRRKQKKRRRRPRAGRIAKPGNHTRSQVSSDHDTRRSVSSAFKA